MQMCVCVLRRKGKDYGLCAFIDFLEGFLALIQVKSSVYNLSRSDRSNKKLFTLPQTEAFSKGNISIDTFRSNL